MFAKCINIKTVFCILTLSKNGWVNHHQYRIYYICITNRMYFNTCVALGLKVEGECVSLFHRTYCNLILIFCTYESQIYFERSCKILTWVKRFFLRYNKMKWCGKIVGVNWRKFTIKWNANILDLLSKDDGKCLNIVCCLANILD